MIAAETQRDSIVAERRQKVIVIDYVVVVSGRVWSCMVIFRVCIVAGDGRSAED